MSKFTGFLKAILKAPLAYLSQSKIVPDETLKTLGVAPDEKIVYIIKTDSISDKIVLEKACKTLGLPCPSTPLQLNNQALGNSATLCLENPKHLLSRKNPKATDALEMGLALLNAHHHDQDLNVKLIPVTIMWGRDPRKEQGSIQAIISDEVSPTWLRKFFIVSFSLRHNFIRFSRPVSIRFMADKHGHEEKSAKKLLRVARFHFYRQRLAAAGPRLWSREQMENSVLSATSVKNAMLEHTENKTQDAEKTKDQAKKLLTEIAADYRGSYIRLADRILSWFWNKIYRGIKVSNAETVRELANKGHEIIYVPCHRSHMDYLLLTYVIYHEGLVPPHIAAGVNLNFWPAGSIFRRCGAFFMRRSFKGNKLYSSIFREYLAQLFQKGYPVKFYTEGGRSRSGRLLQPKTGMLAMTIHAMLRDIERPVSLVPVYIGYEHVMEVSTYLKELKGKNKRNESISGILKAAKSLRNYGLGYVNFGEPISINEFLNNNVENWRESIDPVEPPKPTWLTPTVNKLANRIMTNINDSTALNAGTLTAITLLAANQHALTLQLFKAQLQFYINLQSKAPYSANMTMPESDIDSIITHLVELRKIDIIADPYGDIVQLNSKETISMNYYRNNVIQTFIIPSIVAAQVIENSISTRETINHSMSLLYPLIKSELFLNDNCVTSYTDKVIDALLSEEVIIEDDSVLLPAEASAKRFKLELLARCSDTTLKRYAMVLHTINVAGNISRQELEEACSKMANRLVALSDIKSPEFFDKKITAAFINTLKVNLYIEEDGEGGFIKGKTFDHLHDTVKQMLQNDFRQIALYQSS